MIYKIVVSLILLYSSSDSSVVAQDGFIHLVDFFEYWISLGECKSQETAREISVPFNSCIRNLTSENSTVIYDSWISYCTNVTEYNLCWETFSNGIKEKCGGKVIPRAYQGTLQAFCRNDTGKGNLEEIKKAIKDLQGLTQAEFNKGCSETTGEHWIIACENLMGEMKSDNLCIRQTGMQKCLEKIECKNSLGNWSKKLMQDSRSYLGCSKIFR